MPRVFLGSNVLIYAKDGRDSRKRETAISLSVSLTRERRAVISTQVLQEYAANCLQKLLRPAPEVANEVSLCALTMEVVPITPVLIGRAIEIHTRYQINYWDACILAAAESAGCTELYSEDLNPGQSYAGVRVVDPFAS